MYLVHSGDSINSPKWKLLRAKNNLGKWCPRTTELNQCDWQTSNVTCSSEVVIKTTTIWEMEIDVSFFSHCPSVNAGHRLTLFPRRELRFQSPTTAWVGFQLHPELAQKQQQHGSYFAKAVETQEINPMKHLCTWLLNICHCKEPQARQ